MSWIDWVNGITMAECAPYQIFEDGAAYTAGTIGRADGHTSWPKDEVQRMAFRTQDVVRWISCNV
jgi:hypothetical protein